MLAGVRISQDAGHPEAYRCQRRECNYSSSHCEGLGGFERVEGHMLCPGCARNYRRLLDGFLGR